MRFSLLALLLPFVQAVAQEPSKPAGIAATVNRLLEVRRIYVAPLKGGPQADALRELIVASLNATKLFVLTDNPERADAVLKGAADDQAFINSFDTDTGLSDKADMGVFGAGSALRRGAGAYGGAAVSDRDAHHIKERKHEAYATVHLCNQAGDVLWSTTQESNGGKFRGASADVAAKIAKQLTLDLDRERPAMSLSPGEK